MFGLTYHKAYGSKLISFAAAISRRMKEVVPTTKLTPLRLTNVDAEVATVSFDNRFNDYATRLQYRRDDTEEFEDWDLSELTIEPNEYIEIAGDNSETQGFLGKFSMNGNNIAASGNIMSLIYGVETTKDALVIPNGIRFGSTHINESGMFFRCTGLTTAPELPATTLTEDCYYQLFYETGLTAAPKLPATTLAEHCYSRMFYNCKGLTTAPKLPATTLAESCYAQMFRGCASLTTAPELLATTLMDWCYYQMFYGCSGLTTAPELPATTLAQACYSFMFYGCSSLTTAPELPATTLGVGCYSAMFESCSSLTTAPELPATTLAESCYAQMFEGCSSLTTAPELPATTLVKYCYSYMFSSCTGLNNITVKFTEWGDECTGYWVSNVASSGTFTCPSALDTSMLGVNAIPANWTIITV